MGKITENAVERAVAELKDSIKDIVHDESIYGDEFYLLRWLKAENMNVQKAEQSMRNAAKWRKEYGLAALIEQDYPEGWLKTMPIYPDALSLDGDIIVTVQAGLIDFRGILNELGKKKLVSFLMQAFGQIEQVIIEQNRKQFGDKPLTEKSVKGGIIVADMDQFAARQLRTVEGLQAVVEICKYFVKYFPYVCSTFMFINCNTVTTVLFKIMRPILESPTLKFEVFGQDKAQWQEKVNSFVHSCLLREPFGGTRPIEGIIKRTKMVDRSQILSCVCNLEK